MHKYYAVAISQSEFPCVIMIFNIYDIFHLVLHPTQVITLFIFYLKASLNTLFLSACDIYNKLI